MNMFARRTAPAVLDDEHGAIRDALLASMGADGVYARTARYEDILVRLATLITHYRDERAEVLRFPPVMSRADLERHGYLQNFPNLAGCACALHGDEAEIRAAGSRPGSGWTASLTATELVLTPAACYPLYPIVAARGPVPAGGLIFDVSCDCFRREPSRHIDRLQSFRMREYVFFGVPKAAESFRERWIGRAERVAHDLELSYQIAEANDPFFGRIGQMKAVAQRQAALKFELLIPLSLERGPTACMSFNTHRDHFGVMWNIVDETNEPIHTACVAFGMDRLVLALFCTHGLDVDTWPASVRRVLGF